MPGSCINIFISCLDNFQDSPELLESSKILLGSFLNSSRLNQTLQNIIRTKRYNQKIHFSSFRVKSKGRLFQVVSLPGYLPSGLCPFQVKFLPGCESSRLSPSRVKSSYGLNPFRVTSLPGCVSSRLCLFRVVIFRVVSFRVVGIPGCGFPGCVLAPNQYPVFYQSCRFVE